MVINDYLLNCSTQEKFPGLMAKPPKTAIKMIFHVVVPAKFWEWDETSTMKIRFGNRHLGDWNDCGEFVMSR